MSKPISQPAAVVPATPVDPTEWIVIAAQSDRGMQTMILHIATGTEYKLTSRNLAAVSEWIPSDRDDAAEIWIRFASPAVEPRTYTGKRAVIMAYQLINTAGMNIEGRQKILETAEAMDAALHAAHRAMPPI